MKILSRKQNMRNIGILFALLGVVYFIGFCATAFDFYQAYQANALYDFQLRLYGMCVEYGIFAFLSMLISLSIFTYQPHGQDLAIMPIIILGLGNIIFPVLPFLPIVLNNIENNWLIQLFWVLILPAIVLTGCVYSLIILWHKDSKLIFEKRGNLAGLEQPDEVIETKNTEPSQYSPKLKKTIRIILILVSVLYIIGWIVYMLIETKDWPKNMSVDWASVILYILAGPIGIWFTYFALLLVIKGVREKSFKYVLIVGGAGIFLAISLQFLASFILAVRGFGLSEDFRCVRCGAFVREANGVHLPNHYFNVKMLCTVNNGSSNCHHIWGSAGGGGHADGWYPHVYSKLLSLSHWLFWAAVAFIGIFCVYVAIRRIIPVRHTSK